MMVERIFDAEFIKSAITHPAVWPHVSDDDCGQPEDWNPPLDACIFWMAMIHEECKIGVFMLHPHNCVTLEVHTVVLPQYRGKLSIEATKALSKWVFSETKYQKVITHVPSYNSLALKLAERAGMKIEGINRKSFMRNGILYDQTLLGITKEEACQQQ